MKKIFLLLLCLAGAHAAGAQNTISGEVRNSNDSSKIPFARVSVAGEKTQVATGANGQFSLPASTSSGTLQLRVAALGIDSVFSFSEPFPKLFTLWVTPKGFEISTTTIRGLSAKEVVKEAIKRIPQNYLTEGYLYYGFYRQYHRKDSIFQNLTEARVAALVRPKIVGKKLEAEYRFLPLAIRRQPYRNLPIEGADATDGIVEEVFGVDPVFFQKQSSLASKVFNGATFQFDTTTASLDYYTIQYKANSSNECHGFMWFPGGLRYESYEIGKLIIDRKSFAFVNISNRSFKNNWFLYQEPYNYNIVQPRGLHFFDFRGGQLDVWYKKAGDHWVLSHLRHGFTNDFERSNHAGFGHECLLGQFYEWKTDSVSRYVPGAMLPLFYKSPMLHFVEMPKDTLSSWKSPSFFFFPKEKVYSAVGWKEE